MQYILRNMIIELYGLPASGKSRLARQIEKAGKYTSVRITSRLSLAWYTLNFWLRHPSFSAKLLILIFRHSAGWSDFYTKFMNGLGHRFARYYVPVSTPHRIIDEGIVHNIATLSNDILPKREIEKLLKSMPKLADEYIYVHVHDVLRNERIQKRGYELSRAYNEKDKKLWGDAVRENMSYIKEYLPQCDVRSSSVGIDDREAFFSRMDNL